MQSDLDGVDTDAEDLGDLLVGQVLKLAEEQNRSITFGQFLDHTTDAAISVLEASQLISCCTGTLQAV